ncbi:MAG: cysteine desulfurase [Candidatus Aenigmarchaeota archaeon]|nr:cysteine desulfurase [Candidatus Aenigmarchaeota archaeon]
MKVYLDYATSTPVDKRVMKAMEVYLTEKYGSPSSSHYMGREAAKAVEWSRDVIAKSIKCNPDEIFFTSGGTESDNLAIRGCARANQHLGNHIITSKMEHPPVLNTCYTLGQEGFDVTFLDADKKGFVNPKDVEKNITKKTILVTIQHANAEIGTIQNIAKIGKLCKKNRIIFHTDASQSFTKIPIDTKRMNIDMLTVSANKIYGPKGIGALFVRKGVKLKEQMIGGPQESGMRAGTQNVPGIVGFAKAAEITNKEDVRKMEYIRDVLMNDLLGIPETKLNGPMGKKRLCNNINISFNDVSAKSLVSYMDTKGIMVSSDIPVKSQFFNALSAIGLEEEEIAESVRFSVGRDTTRKETDFTAKVVSELVEYLRKVEQ